MESFFGHAKDELHLRRCSTFGEVVAEIADYIDYYNNWRPQAGLGRMTPVEFREYLLAKPICLPVPVAAARENGDPRSGSPFLNDQCLFKCVLDMGSTLSLPPFVIV